jgi:hypothetical protein
METNWCFHLFVAFIILVGDLPVKVAEDFAAIGERRGSASARFEARRILQG